MKIAQAGTGATLLGMHVSRALLTTTRRVACLLVLGLMTATCGVDSTANSSFDLTAEETLAVNSARKIVSLPYWANEELQARLAVLEYLGLPYDNMADIFDRVEQQTAECMNDKGHSYVPVPGAIASLPVLAHGLSTTEYGHFPHSSSAAREIVLGPFDGASRAAIADRGEDSEKYFADLYGNDPADLAGGCSGQAQTLLGPESLDSILDSAATRLMAAMNEEPQASGSLADFTACLGSSRDNFLVSLDDAVAAAATPDEKSRVSMEFAATELECIKTTLIDSDAIVRERAALAIQHDHRLAREICGLVGTLGWKIPAEVAKC